MTMDDIYAEMKAALRHFELQFSDMERVSVSIDGGRFIMSHEGREASLVVTEIQDEGEGK